MSITTYRVQRAFESGNNIVVISAGSSTYIRPVGGDLASCCMDLLIEGQVLTYIENPFASVRPLNFFYLAVLPLERLLTYVTLKPVMYLGDPLNPLFRIVGVDTNIKTVTIELDKRFEVFDPEVARPA